MSDLPQGTVTFAFTDIEGSTALLKRLAESYADVISAHRRIVRETFTRHGGVEIDTQGDAFFFAFERARDAVAAAAEVQRAHVAYEWPDAEQVRMRVGLHTGEPTLAQEGYLGLDVVRAARLCGVCGGGQVLLSETTRALVGSVLPAGVSVYPLGERHLKDMDEPEQIYELEIEGVDSLTTPEPQPAAPSTAVPEKETPHGRKTPSKQWEEDFERRVEELAEGFADDLLGQLEKSWGQKSRRMERKEPGLDRFIADANELAERIRLEMNRVRGDSPNDEG